MNIYFFETRIVYAPKEFVQQAAAQFTHLGKPQQKSAMVKP
jgi:hypothetical protein